MGVESPLDGVDVSVICIAPAADSSQGGSSAVVEIRPIVDEGEFLNKADFTPFIAVCFTICLVPAFHGVIVRRWKKRFGKRISKYFEVPDGCLPFIKYYPRSLFKKGKTWFLGCRNASFVAAFLCVVWLYLQNISVGDLAQVMHSAGPYSVMLILPTIIYALSCVILHFRLKWIYELFGDLMPLLQQRNAEVSADVERVNRQVTSFLEGTQSTKEEV